MEFLYSEKFGGALRVETDENTPLTRQPSVIIREIESQKVVFNGHSSTWMKSESEEYFVSGERMFVLEKIDDCPPLANKV